MDERITQSVSGDGGRDDGLHAILLDRGWRSDRAGLPEEGDRFEWPPSTPPALSTTVAAANEHGTFGTTIYVDPFDYVVFAPQTDDKPMQPRALYSTRRELLHDIHRIEDWR